MPKSPTIIVVDDDASMRQALGRILTTAGWEAEVYPSAEALLDSSKAESAAAFILDICLPKLSGFELCARLIDAGTRAPVIFITAHDRPNFRQEADRHGAAGFFIKPFSSTELLATLTQTV